MRCLVTGDSGFVAQHLTVQLESLGHEVYGFDIKEGNDFRDYENVRRAIDKTRPDWIFHVGAMAYVPESFADPVRAIETNTIGSLNILEAVRKLGLKTRILLCGTSEEYGGCEDEPLTEKSLPNPSSPYAISKLAMDNFGVLYAKSYNMNIVVTRAFNHTGPGRGEMYAESSFAKQIVEIEKGTRKKLIHGNLGSVRNYTDVRDIVKAYIKAIVLPSGVYNICSNQNASMQQILNVLLSKANVDVWYESSPELFRPADFSFKKPNCGKFTRLTQWRPEINLEQTLEDLLNDWRKKLS